MLTVIGECLIDLVCEQAGDPSGRTFIARPGGSPLNIAVGLARLGHPTALLARFADDAFGRIVRAHAVENGLDLTAAPSAREPSTAAVVSLDDEGRATYDFYVDGTADWLWRPAELDALPPGTTLLHTGSLAAWTPPGSDLIIRLCRRLRGEEQVLLSYDPNVRPRLMGSHDVAVRRVEASVGAAHVVKASDEDLAWLYPDRPPADVARRWLGLGAHLVVVTCGPDGATAYRRRQPPLEQPAREITLVDTVGAGDAFMSGLLSALVDAGAGSPARLTDLADDALVTSALDRALAVAALTCERAGADPPRRAAVDALGTAVES